VVKSHTGFRQEKWEMHHFSRIHDVDICTCFMSFACEHKLCRFRNTFRIDEACGINSNMAHSLLSDDRSCQFSARRSKYSDKFANKHVQIELTKLSN
jgi:hypothetical protein